MQDWSDWEVVKPKKSQPKSAKFNAEDWEVIKEQPYKDESFMQKLPRNVAIGAANLAHSTLSAPHDITQGLEQSTQEFGNAINPGLLEQYGVNHPSFDYDIASQIPKPAPRDFAQELGQNGGGTFADNAIQKIVEYAPEIFMGGNALRKVVPHLTKKGASKKLNNLKKIMAGKEPLNVKPELIEDMRQFLPDTDAYRTLLDEAKTGDYNRLFDLQSDTGKYSNKLARDYFSAANRNKGRAGKESMNALLNAMHKDMQAKNLAKESELLSQGRNDYRRYMKFRPYRNLLGGAAGTALAASLLPKNALVGLIEKIASQHYK